MTNRLDGYAKELDFCTSCPKLCTFACPVSNAEKSEAVTPWAKMTLLDLLRKGHLPLNEETAEPLYHCLSCRLCTTYCKHEIEVGEILNQGRAWLVERGRIRPELDRLRENHVLHGNAHGPGLEAALRELVEPEWFEENAHVVFFPGSDTVVKWPEDIRRTFSIFKKLGIDYVACFEDGGADAGLSLYRAGFFSEFKNLARNLARRLSRYKVIVTTCPQTAYTLKALYLEQGFDFSDKVRLLAEFLEPYLKNAVFERELEKRAVFFDSTYLSRYLGLRILPRDIMKRLYESEPAELIWNRDGAYACGCTGVYHHMFPEFSADISREVLRQAREVWAQVIVTASPVSAASLHAVRETNDPEIRTLTQQIDKCLSGER